MAAPDDMTTLNISGKFTMVRPSHHSSFLEGRNVDSVFADVEQVTQRRQRRNSQAPRCRLVHSQGYRCGFYLSRGEPLQGRQQR